MRTSEKTYLFETSDYYKMKNPLLFYDISELGWARYISAHINYLTKNGKKVAVCCRKEREPIYNGFATEILPIPEEFFNKYGHLVSASHHLHEPETDTEYTDRTDITNIFKKNYPNYNVIEIEDYSNFRHERIFEPYKHKTETEKFCEKFRNCILVFPRFRNSRFAQRNLPYSKWLYVISSLCQEFPNLDIISIGEPNSTLNFNPPFQNWHNLISYENNLDILICLCNTKKAIASFGTQSGILHVATACGSPTYEIGTDEDRIYGPDKYEISDISVKFWKVDKNNNGYIVDIVSIIDEMINDLKNNNLYEKEHNGSDS